MTAESTRPAPPAFGQLALLRGVSRSFYVSIRLLPGPLRAPVGLGYLLARATDTVADTATLAAGQRSETLATLAAAIAGDGAARAALARLGPAFAQAQHDADERALILALPQCLDWLDRVDAADREDIRTVLGHITRGQMLDVQRFGSTGGHGGLQALADTQALEDYTYLVAGCVGEFWTCLCLRHLPRFAALPAERMHALGRAYGSGLQLINILRDLGGDLAAGRCYLPADALAATGLSPHDLLRQPQQVMPLYDHWLAQAGQRLDQGMQYCAAVRPRRVRAASALPALIGARTLALLRQAGPAALQARVKVPRGEVRGILLATALTLAANGPLQARFARLGR